MAVNESAPNGSKLKHISPLRYPGGKAALADFLAQTITSNGLSAPSYFEPFAGGAGAALCLLQDEVVSEIHLNDLDPRIATFWKAVLDDSERFAEKILSVPVTVDEWRIQKAVCQEADTSKPFELGFATFYLNRCNRSGVIAGAAPIGGYAQKGEWKIGARFYRDSLTARVRALGNMRDQIHVTGMDAHEFLVKHLPRGHDRGRVFVYLDPPYHGKGSRLYLNSYEDKDHKRLADYLQRQKYLKWIASYDDAPFIRGLYGTCNIADNSLRYSLQRNMQAQELLITPTYLAVPK
jgi:DNA adenine methylase